MKKRIIYLFAILVTFSATSCKDFLEIKPEGEIPAEEALQTPDDLQALLVSCYDAARSDNFYGGSYWVISELFSDNLDGRDLSGNYLSFFQHNTTIFNQDIRDAWAEPYRVIYRCNVLLEGMDLVEGLTDEDRNRITAEAKFLRGISHFELVRMFGQPFGYTSDNSHNGVPLRLQASQEVISRASVGEVYDAILTDLQEAAAALPDNNSGYASSWAAKGALAKVYFQMNDFGNAEDMANEVITMGPFMLTATPNGRFSESVNSESVFSMISTGTADHSGGKLQGNWRSDGGNIPSLRVNAATYAIASADTSDLRGKEWYTVVDEGLQTEMVFSNRFNDFPFFNVPVISLTELVLIRAESRAEGNDLSGAESDLNLIRARAEVDPINGFAQSALIQAIRDERRLEMIGEGIRLQDLKRAGAHDSPNLQINGDPWDCNGMILQLPDQELSGNPDIELNPEGGC